jgi:hypothetical protein
MAPMGKSTWPLVVAVVIAGAACSPHKPPPPAAAPASPATTSASSPGAVQRGPHSTLANIRLPAGAVFDGNSSLEERWRCNTPYDPTVTFLGGQFATGPNTTPTVRRLGPICRRVTTVNTKARPRVGLRQTPPGGCGRMASHCCQLRSSVRTAAPPTPARSSSIISVGTTRRCAITVSPAGGISSSDAQIFGNDRLHDLSGSAVDRLDAGIDERS